MRHLFQKKYLLPACLLGGVSVVLPAQQTQPNIILILADDLGYSELGCYGNTFNETPNLDAMAQNGIRFTQAYAAQTVSSPSRVALMTGLYPARTGITDYLRPDDSMHLNESYKTVAEALKTKGYHTGIIGKWHLTGYKKEGAPYESSPEKHGFDEVILNENEGIGAGSYFYPYHFNQDVEKLFFSEKEFLVDRLNEEAVRFIDRNKDEPFFLYLSHYAVHTYVHGKPDDVEHFRRKPCAGKSAPHPDNPENDPYKKWPADFRADRNNPHLAAQLKTIDEGVGMIINRLRETEMLDNTIIIFYSDNGGEAPQTTTNYPLRAGKSTLYEGGIRVPLIIYAPDKFVQGKVADDVVVTHDLYPTFCELTGINNENIQSFDGQSFLSTLLTDKQNKKERDLFWHYPLKEQHFLGGRSSGAIRSGDWKLIEFFDTGDIELYNLNDDIGENNNLYNQNPKQADILLNKLKEWRVACLVENYCQ